MKRSFRFVYVTGEPLANVKVKLTKSSNSYSENTDSNGRCSIDFPHNWADKLMVDNQIIKEHWDIGIKTDFEYEDFQIQKPGEQTAPRAKTTPFGHSKDFHTSMRGRVYYADGTIPHKQFNIKVEFPGKGYEIQTDKEGEFSIEIEPMGKLIHAKKWYVNGHSLSTKFVYQRDNDANDDSYVVILPANLGKGGHKGGLVSGQVFGQDGAKAYGVKVRADAKGVFTKGGETLTDKNGRFALHVDGQVKDFYVDGNHPESIQIKTANGIEEISAGDIHVGMFGVRLVKRDKFLGIF